MHYISGSYFSHELEYNLKDGEWTVKQSVGNIYSLPKNFTELVPFLQTQKAEYESDFLSGPCEGRFNSIAPELHNTRFTVEFTELYLDYSGSIIHVWGKRKPVQQELDWILADQTIRDNENKERNRREFERLKQQFELKT